MIGDIRRWIANHPNEIRLFCVSFLVHLVASIFLYAKFGETVLWFENEDAVGYLEIARHLAQGDGFIHSGIIAGVRTPAYPLALAVLFVLRLPMPWAILLFQNFVASFTAVLLYRIGNMFFSSRVGGIAGYLYALEPYMIMTANLATTETVFNCIIVGFLYAFGKWYTKESSMRLLAISAFLLGLAVLTRPVAKYAPIVVLLLMVFRWIQDKNIRRFAKHAVIFLGIFFAVLAPWMFRQYAQFGTTRLTNIDANMLYFRIAPIVVSAEERIGYVDAIGRLKARLLARYPEYTDQQGYTFAYYDFMVEEAKKLVVKNPGVVAKYYALSLVPGLTGTGYEYIIEEVSGFERRVARVSFTALLLKGDFQSYKDALLRIDIFQVALLGGAFAWVVAYLLIFWSFWGRVKWKEQWPVFAILILFGGYFIFFSLGPQTHARYRMPSFPFLYLLLAFALAHLYESRFRRHSRIQ